MANNKWAFGYGGLKPTVRRTLMNDVCSYDLLYLRCDEAECIYNSAELKHIMGKCKRSKAEGICVNDNLQVRPLLLEIFGFVIFECTWSVYHKRLELKDGRTPVPKALIVSEVMH